MTKIILHGDSLPAESPLSNPPTPASLNQARSPYDLPGRGYVIGPKAYGPKVEADLASSDEVFLTEQDLARRWRQSVKTIQAARSKGGSVRFCKIGRSVRYRLSDIEAYEAANTHGSTSDGEGR